MTARSLRWPLPALLTWIGAWALHRVLVTAGAAPPVAVALASLAGLACAVFAGTTWRRLFTAAGFPLAMLAASAAAAWPAWAWLLPLAALALLYPLRTWGDAPLFPTPRGALGPLAARLPMPPGAEMLDAGCGLGDGVRELQRTWPAARVSGIEWSRPMAWLARRRCPGARIERGDMWSRDWRDADLVYAFQRPESMARLWAKACAELRPGAWLVSLAFPVPQVSPTVTLDPRPDRGDASAERRRVYAYRMPQRR